MTLAEDLAAWVASRPDWQKEAVSRFCRNESLTAEDIAAVADRLIAGTHPPVSTITPAEVPGSSTSAEPVRVVGLADVTGVNALMPGQSLTFAANGLTVIYGDNASGKSGYARLIREAVTARIKAELLGDVFSSERTAQGATVAYLVGERSGSWTLGDPADGSLASVRFYDEQCGEAYVSLASEISYRPSALTLLDRLRDACDEVQHELTRRLAENAQLRPTLPTLAEGTRARAFLDSLDSSTAAEAIEEATAPVEGHERLLAERLQEEARLKGSDPKKEQSRLSQLATHWGTVEKHVEEVSSRLDRDAVAETQRQREQAKSLREAARIASARSFDGEPLSGVGSGSWRALWNAARAFSLTEAYHDHEFPRVDTDARCVLCHQPLSSEGSDRLARFDDFVSDTTSRDAEAAERHLATARNALLALQTTPAGVTQALLQLEVGGEEGAKACQEWLLSASTLASELIAWIDETSDVLPAGLESSPGNAIDVRRQRLLTDAESIDATTFEDSLRTLRSEIAEIHSHLAIQAAKDDLYREVGRLKARSKIEAARRATDTTGITRKSTELTTTYVTAIVRDQFTRETERLRLRRVTLDPTGGRKHVTLEHKPKLLGATVNIDVDDVLSEGEQTALGLAGFLTEVMFDGSKSAVVLDDPVSSLDAGRRSHVATRLVELAADRQVVVFTHEATFVTALNKAARDAGVTVTERAILRQGERPGLTSEKHPWSVKDIPARIDWLGAELSRLSNERDQLDTDEYTQRAQQWAGRLSQAWERAINLEVVGELVDRGTNEVRPRMFKMLVGISEQDDTDYQSGYAKVSEWAPRHDQAPEVNFIAPDPDEMGEELTRFKEWFARIKKYKR